MPPSPRSESLPCHILQVHALTTVTHTDPKTPMCHSLIGLTDLKAFRSSEWIERFSRTQPAANMQNDKGSGTYQILDTGTFYF